MTDVNVGIIQCMSRDITFWMKDECLFEPEKGVGMKSQKDKSQFSR